jgi:hypothetical protein
MSIRNVLSLGSLSENWIHYTLTPDVDKIRNLGYIVSTKGRALGPARRTEVAAVWSILIGCIDGMAPIHAGNFYF